MDPQTLSLHLRAEVAEAVARVDAFVAALNHASEAVARLNEQLRELRERPLKVALEVE